MRNVALTETNDTFDATAESGVVVFANHGNDYILGSALADTIYGGYGADTLRGSGGNDLIQDDGGISFIRGGEGNDTVLLGTFGIVNSGTIYGGEGDDSVLVTENIDDGSSVNRHYQVFGGAGNDTVNLDVAGFSTVNGNLGNDVISGYGELRGGQGDDVISFGSVVYGDLGNDYLDASNATVGYDGVSVHFVFENNSGIDTISQFEPGSDKIVLLANLNGSGILTAADAASHVHLVSATVDPHTGDNDYMLDLGGGNKVFIDMVAATLLNARTTLTADDFIIQ